MLKKYAPLLYIVLLLLGIFFQGFCLFDVGRVGKRFMFARRDS